MELACENEEVEIRTHTWVGARGSLALALTWWTGVVGAAGTSERNGAMREPGTGTTSPFTSGGNRREGALER